MNIGKKLAAVILCVFMLWQIPCAFANDKDAASAENTVYKERTAILSALSVFSFGGKESSELVTRGEFAAAVSDLMGYSNVQLDSSVPFPFVDVKSDAPYRNQIKLMIYLGHMNGVNSVEFRPDDNVTYEQAIKVLVSALGYNAFAVNKGGYPIGYMIIGGEIGILSEITVENSAPLTWETLVSVLFKATEAEVSEIASIGDTVSYRQDKDKTLLNVYHSIYKERGILSDNGETALSGKTQAGENCVIIDGIRLSNAFDGADEFLGMRVDFYYRDDDAEKTLLYAKAAKNRNNVLVIDAEDLLTQDKSFGKMQIVYSDPSNPQKTSTASISPYADFIYNGAAFVAFTADSYKISCGKLTLIDADSDGKYETIKAEEYEDIFVSDTSEQYKKIYSEYCASLNYGNYRYISFENTAGEKISLSDVKSGNVLSVFKSKDDTKIKCVLCSDNFEITVSAIEKQGEDIYIYDENQRYALSRTLADNINSAASKATLPEIGCRYNAYLNFAGEIAMIKVITPRYEYAYALGVGQGRGLESGLGLIEVYLESDDCIVIKTKDKVLINNEKPATAGKNIASISDFYDENGNFVPQLVKIKRNALGELIEIETCNTLTESANGFIPDAFALNYMTTVADSNGFHKASTSGDQIYNGKVKSVNGMYAYDNDTKIFLIDDDLYNLTTTDRERVSVISASKFSADYLNANFKVYDADENWVAGAIVASGPTGFNERIFVIKECKEILDEFGEIRLQADGYWRGNLWTFRESHSGVFKAAIEKAGYPGEEYLKPGDMVRISFDLNDEIYYAELIASPLRSKTPFSKVLSGNNIANCVSAVMFGIPVSKTAERIGIYTDNYFVSGFPLSAATYTLLDAKTQKLEQVTISDLPTVGNWNEDGSFTIEDGNVMIAAYRLRGVVTDIVAIVY